MSARLLAAFGLISLIAQAASPNETGGALHTLLVYVDAASASAPTLPAMRREAEKLLRSAGYRIEWRESRDDRGRETVADLVFVKLQGSCATTAEPAPSPVALADDAALRLASTAVSDGVVLPYTKVDCAALTNLLTPMLYRGPAAQRTYHYGRAMGRLLAHELYHVLAQTRDHATAGVGKPCFTAADLVSDRFEFESVALARLRKPATADASAEATLPAERR